MTIRCGGSLDELDVRILRELLQGQATSPLDPDFRKSFGAIGRKLGVDRDTVRNRIRRFHTSGFIRGWRTIVNPNLFHGGECAIWLHVPPTRVEDFLEKARLMPGVLMLVRYHGPLICLIFRYYEEGAARKQMELMRKIAGADRIRAAHIPFPPCNIALSRSDRSILRALYADPRRRLTEIAGELGVSTRTVRRKLERLAGESAFFAFPALDPKALQGTVMAQLHVASPVERRRDAAEKIAATLEPYLWHVFFTEPFDRSAVTTCVYNLAVPNVAKGREALRRAMEAPGVLEARLELCEDFETLFDIFDEEMENRFGAPAMTEGPDYLAAGA